MRWWWITGILAILAAGCSTEGELKIRNNTAHPLYCQVDGESFVLDGYTDPDQPQSRSFTFDTGTAFLFDKGDDVEVALMLEGETFLMSSDTTATVVVVEPDETTNVYTYPTHASLKIDNKSDVAVQQVLFRTDQSPIWHGFEESSIPAGETWFKQIAYSYDDDVFTYFFRVVMQDSTQLEYPSYPEGVELELDEQYLIELQ